MTNHELIESGALSHYAVRLDSSRDRYILEEDAGEWGWKFLGLVTLVVVSVGGWIGVILAARHLVH